MIYQSKSERRKKRRVTKLSLYQGRHHANDRQGIERCEANEYSTSADIKATAEWTSLVFGSSLSHDGIEGRVESMLIKFIYWPWLGAQHLTHRMTALKSDFDYSCL